MHQPHTLRLPAWARLIVLSLLLGLGLLANGWAIPAHAASTTTITSCDETSLRNAITNAASGDSIAFGCSGTIPLSSTLGISKNLTLDGNGHRVTLDGGNSVQVLNVSSGVSFTLNALTIAHGRALSSGGGLINNGALSISNSTFVNNSAIDGGGLLNGSTASISNSTFVNNSASRNGGGLFNYNTVSIGGSIVANNTGSDCGSGDTITDQGYNLSSGSDCGFTGTGSLQNTDPKLDPNGLQSNGGPTQTIALQSNSPAIDHIPAASCPATDQRGVTRPDAGETTCDIGAYESNYDDDLGLSNLPANITTDATSPQGAVVHYTPPTATDESGDSSTASVTCTPASGSTFPISTTKVTCTATDSDDTTSPVSGSFQVVVKDVTAPLLSVPSTITVNSSSSQGAVVNYTVTATDPDNAASDLTISCSPASGSTFAIGTTTVNCSASDPAGNSSHGSFQVVVKGAAAQVSDLINLVNSDHLASSLQNSLDVKLNAALKAVKAGQTATACSDLSDFIGQAQSQSGKGLTTSQATQLIAAATNIQHVLGC